MSYDTENPMENDENDDNTALVQHIIRKYSEKKEYHPVKNVSINIKTEKRVYKLIRLDDEQYYLLRKNSLAIFDDYRHLMSLSMDKDLIYSSFSKMYVSLKALFGESGKYYDDWKGSFSFPFLIHFHKDREEFGYVMNVHNLRSSIEFSMAKLIYSDDTKFRREILHNPFEEFPKEEMCYFINFFVGFLTGYFSATEKYYDEFFFKTAQSNLILFGYKDGVFFDYQYDSEDEFQKAVDELKGNKDKAESKTGQGKRKKNRK